MNPQITIDDLRQLNEAELSDNELLEVCVVADISLWNASLSNLNLAGVNLRHANLSDVSMANTNLSEADLRDTDLRDAVLRGCNLRGADLRHANMWRTNLQAADCRQARWEGASISGNATIIEAVIDYPIYMSSSNESIAGVVARNYVFIEDDFEGTYQQAIEWILDNDTYRLRRYTPAVQLAQLYAIALACYQTAQAKKILQAILEYQNEVEGE